jgi:hypothetical protein
LRSVPLYEWLRSELTPQKSGTNQHDKGDYNFPIKLKFHRRFLRFT